MKIPIGCQCGQVSGKVILSSEKELNRLVCCCKDCQNFANKLNAENVLDEFGGTELLQVLPSSIQLEQGIDKLLCVKLSAKGLHRWYTVCCNTLVGNSISAKVPFFGIINSFVKLDNRGLDAIKPISIYLYARDALKPIPLKNSHSKMPITLLGRALFKMLLSKIKGNGLPSPFYSENGYAIAKPIIL